MIAANIDGQQKSGESFRKNYFVLLNNYCFTLFKAIFAIFFYLIFLIGTDLIEDSFFAVQSLK